MSDAPSPPWKLPCDYCDWYILVFNRGAHGRDPGAGVEAALMMQQHIEERHVGEADDE